MSIRIILTGIMCLAMAGTASARRIENWSYQRLLETSDIVVIATLEKVEAWDKPLPLPLFADVLEAKCATFHVEGILKGKLSSDELELIHCHLKLGRLVEDGPLLADFREPGRILKIVEVDGVPEMRVHQESKPHYLLFLKARPDGRFVPVAGQVDSFLSVRLLSSGE